MQDLTFMRRRGTKLLTSVTMKLGNSWMCTEANVYRIAVRGRTVSDLCSQLASVVNEAQRRPGRVCPQCTSGVVAMAADGAIKFTDLHLKICKMIGCNSFRTLYTSAEHCTHACTSRDTFLYSSCREHAANRHTHTPAQAVQNKRLSHSGL